MKHTSVIPRPPATTTDIEHRVNDPGLMTSLAAFTQRRATPTRSGGGGGGRGLELRYSKPPPPCKTNGSLQMKK